MEHSGVVGAGHSAGAAVLAICEHLWPRTFCQLVAIEPIVFPPLVDAGNPLAEAAERRRRMFASPQAVFERYRGKSPFLQWTASALAEYAVHGFRSTEAAQAALGPGAVELKCQPAVEAAFYRSSRRFQMWDRLPGLQAPAVVVVGSTSTTMSLAYAEELAARWGTESGHAGPRARAVVVDAATHYVPQEQPEAVAELLAAAVRAGDETGAQPRL
eukprot:TRINITY_DN5523_c0_g1_i4.p2 TRINITY_DN5523_c0_g1~~TRINITY_DN5523_c0_g1_i4.p2  ORF type:complete len:215 (-),score=52.58 TRINITY_DN5523_c0_g1_i4:50-694(-)